MKALALAMSVLVLASCSSPKSSTPAKISPMPPLPPGAKSVVAASSAKRVTMSLTRAAAPMSATASATISPFPESLRVILTNLTHSANYRVDAADNVLGPWQEIYLGSDGAETTEIYDRTWLDRKQFYYRLVPVP